jgi:uncharacterized protein
MDVGLDSKLRGLRSILGSYSSALVAFSGGVDSSLLAFVAREVLGDRMTAVIVASPLLPPRELERAINLASAMSLPLEVADADELSLPGFKGNPRDRCYICKRFRLELLWDLADEGAWEAVMEGSNLDDAGAHRPGKRAVEELGAVSPLEEAALTKAEVRAVAESLGLPNWDAPSRPCLATRFPYGMELDRGLMRRVGAAEEILERAGLRELRVRIEAPHAARIEVGTEELSWFDEKDNRERLVKELRGLGFMSITLDLEGYRSGSMDERRPAGRCRTLFSAEGYD